jgi:hypothetical protein
LGSSDHAAGVFRVPDGPGRFLLHQDWTFRDDTLHAARSSHTVWGFSSAPGETPPLLGVGYGPQVDAGGAATALRPLPLNLSFGHLDGSDAPAQITQVRLWWSADDGTAWHELNVRRTAADAAAAIVPAPALRAGGSLSLRVQATDSAGNSIDQTNIGLVPVH